MLCRIHLHRTVRKDSILYNWGTIPTITIAYRGVSLDGKHFFYANPNECDCDSAVIVGIVPQLHSLIPLWTVPWSYIVSCALSVKYRGARKRLYE